MKPFMDALKTSLLDRIKFLQRGAGHFFPKMYINPLFRLKSAFTPMAKELRSSATVSGELLSSAPPDLQPVYIGEKLKCLENGSIKLLWKNIVRNFIFKN